MAENHRNYTRHEITINVALSLLNDESRMLKSRNISEGGMFLLVDDIAHYPIGEIVHVHYLDPLMDDADTFKDAIIVHISDDGIGISFVEIGEF